MGLRELKALPCIFLKCTSCIKFFFLNTLGRWPFTSLCRWLQSWSFYNCLLQKGKWNGVLSFPILAIQFAHVIAVIWNKMTRQSKNNVWNIQHINISLILYEHGQSGLFVLKEGRAQNPSRSYVSELPPEEWQPALIHFVQSWGGQRMSDQPVPCIKNSVKNISSLSSRPWQRENN